MKEMEQQLKNAQYVKRSETVDEVLCEVCGNCKQRMLLCKDTPAERDFCKYLQIEVNFFDSCRYFESSFDELGDDELDIDAYMPYVSQETQRSTTRREKRRSIWSKLFGFQ